MQSKPISFSGSRHLPLSSPAAQLIIPSLCLLFARSGIPLATGCCPTGADLAVRQFCTSSQIPLAVFTAASRAPAHLRARTLEMVGQSSALFVFPVSVAVPHSGSWLSAFAASSCGIPLFVYLPGVPLSTLPLCKGIVFWRHVYFCGFNFFQPVCSQQVLGF